MKKSYSELSSKTPKRLQKQRAEEYSVEENRKNLRSIDSQLLRTIYCIVIKSHIDFPRGLFFFGKFSKIRE
ncbi:hypothetical protein JTE90_001594 [Oedothorax gibbosus]|uniref:Uncharacterized protein n=1 Tax=Oedothorax gibbosus TaxID=931172 RepID=A0AAV6VME5_9ARAC|nr:hypothetical protein JTE90_001594 [Oedothorax gibbosus]